MRLQTDSDPDFFTACLAQKQRGVPD